MEEEKRVIVDMDATMRDFFCKCVIKLTKTPPRAQGIKADDSVRISTIHLDRILCSVL